MRRRLRSILSLISLVLCLTALIVIWVRSYWILETWLYNPPGNLQHGTEMYLDGCVGRGKLLFQYQYIAWDQKLMGSHLQPATRPYPFLGYHHFAERVANWPPQFYVPKAIWFTYENQTEHSSSSDSWAFQFSPASHEPPLLVISHWDFRFGLGWW